MQRVRSDAGGERGAWLSGSLSLLLSCSDTLMCARAVGSSSMVPACCSSDGDGGSGKGGSRRRGDSAAAAHIVPLSGPAGSCGSPCGNSTPGVCAAGTRCPSLSAAVERVVCLWRGHKGARQLRGRTGFILRCCKQRASPVTAPEIRTRQSCITRVSACQGSSGVSTSSFRLKPCRLAILLARGRCDSPARTRSCSVVLSIAGSTHRLHTRPCTARYAAFPYPDWAIGGTSAAGPKPCACLCRIS